MVGRPVIASDLLRSEDVVADGRRVARWAAEREDGGHAVVQKVLS
jgi:hypothetical protein